MVTLIPTEIFRMPSLWGSWWGKHCIFKGASRLTGSLCLANAMARETMGKQSSFAFYQERLQDAFLLRIDWGNRSWFLLLAAFFRGREETCCSGNELGIVEDGFVLLLVFLLCLRRKDERMDWVQRMTE